MISLKKKYLKLLHTWTNAKKGNIFSIRSVIWVSVLQQVSGWDHLFGLWYGRVLDRKWKCLVGDDNMQSYKSAPSPPPRVNNQIKYYTEFVLDFKFHSELNFT